MIAFFYYPFYLVSFWYKDVLGGTFDFFASFNRYLVSLLSIPLLLKTFFKPLKNEYREGLVLFSIIFGIVIKSSLLSITIPFVIVVLFIELLIGVLLFVLPLGLIMILFGWQIVSK